LAQLSAESGHPIDLLLEGIIMKAKQILTAVALIAAATSSAYAADVGTQGKTRAEVVAELQQARANQGYQVGGNDYQFFTYTPSTRTRAEVQAELNQARDDGSLAAREANYPVVASTTASRSRADVRAEAIQAAKAHTAGTDYIGG
jgi:opacity protein-like surface antigen